MGNDRRVGRHAWQANPAGYRAGTMGQPITVTEKPTKRAGIVRFELNRALTGMGHEQYAAPPTPPAPTP